MQIITNHICKGSVPHLIPADSPAFLSSPLSDESRVSTPKRQKEQKEENKKEEMRLNYIQKQVIRSCELAGCKCQ